MKNGFDKTHPFPLSVQLKKDAFGERRAGKSIIRFVEEIARQHKIVRVPIPKTKAKPLANSFFETDPRQYVPCLLASVTLVEAGPTAFEERTRAWRERRIPDVLASPADRAFEECIPPAVRAVDRPDVRGEIRALMDAPQVTVAIVPLISLAQAGGILDDLQGQGYTVEGPRWK